MRCFQTRSLIRKQHSSLLLHSQVPRSSPRCASSRSRAMARRASLSGNSDVLPRYGGYCTICGGTHWLPCTPEAAAHAQELISLLHKHGRLDYESTQPDPRSSLDWLYTLGPGRMLGVLLAVDDNGQQHVLKAFSGQITESWFIPGWVGPVAGIINESPTYIKARKQIEGLSAQLHQLDAMEKAQQLQTQQRRGGSEQQIGPSMGQQDELQQTNTPVSSWAVFDRQQQLRQQQQQQLQGGAETEAQQANTNSMHFIAEQRQLLKKQRKALSHTLMQQIQHSYHTQSASNKPIALLDVYLKYVQLYDNSLPVTTAGGFRGFPAGVGDCCAPKLLHAAAAAGLKPVGLAEVWCGSAPGTATRAKLGRPIVLNDENASRRHLEFYGMCDKCRAVLGTMLCDIECVCE